MEGTPSPAQRPTSLNLPAFAAWKHSIMRNEQDGTPLRESSDRPGGLLSSSPTRRRGSSSTDRPYSTRFLGVVGKSREDGARRRPTTELINGSSPTRRRGSASGDRPYSTRFLGVVGKSPQDEHRRQSSDLTDGPSGLFSLTGSSTSDGPRWASSWSEISENRDDEPPRRPVTRDPADDGPTQRRGSSSDRPYSTRFLGGVSENPQDEPLRRRSTDVVNHGPGSLFSLTQRRGSSSDRPRWASSWSVVSENRRQATDPISEDDSPKVEPFSPSRQAAETRPSWNPAAENRRRRSTDLAHGSRRQSDLLSPVGRRGSASVEAIDRPRWASAWNVSSGVNRRQSTDLSDGPSLSDRRMSDASTRTDLLSSTRRRGSAASVDIGDGTDWTSRQSTDLAVGPSLSSVSHSAVLTSPTSRRGSAASVDVGDRPGWTNSWSNMIKNRRQSTDLADGTSLSNVTRRAEIRSPTSRRGSAASVDLADGPSRPHTWRSITEDRRQSTDLIDGGSPDASPNQEIFSPTRRRGSESVGVSDRPSWTTSWSKNRRQSTDLTDAKNIDTSPQPQVFSPAGRRGSENIGLNERPSWTNSWSTGSKSRRQSTDLTDVRNINVSPKSEIFSPTRRRGSENIGLNDRPNWINLWSNVSKNRRQSTDVSDARNGDMLSPKPETFSATRRRGSESVGLNGRPSWTSSWGNVSKNRRQSSADLADATSPNASPNREIFPVTRRRGSESTVSDRTGTDKLTRGPGENLKQSADHAWAGPETTSQVLTDAEDKFRPPQTPEASGQRNSQQDEDPSEAEAGLRLQEPQNRKTSGGTDHDVGAATSQGRHEDETEAPGVVQDTRQGLEAQESDSEVSPLPPGAAAGRSHPAPEISPTESDEERLDEHPTASGSEPHDEIPPPPPPIIPTERNETSPQANVVIAIPWDIWAGETREDHQTELHEEWARGRNQLLRRSELDEDWSHGFPPENSQQDQCRDFVIETTFGQESEGQKVPLISETDVCEIRVRDILEKSPTEHCEETRLEFPAVMRTESQHGDVGHEQKTHVKEATSNNTLENPPTEHEEDRWQEFPEVIQSESHDDIGETEIEKDTSDPKTEHGEHSQLESPDVIQMDSRRDEDDEEKTKVEEATGNDIHRNPVMENGEDRWLEFLEVIQMGSHEDIGDEQKTYVKESRRDSVLENPMTDKLTELEKDRSHCSITILQREEHEDDTMMNPVDPQPELGESLSQQNGIQDEWMYDTLDIYKTESHRTNEKLVPVALLSEQDDNIGNENSTEPHDEQVDDKQQKVPETEPCEIRSCDTRPGTQNEVAEERNNRENGIHDEVARTGLRGDETFPQNELDEDGRYANLASPETQMVGLWIEETTSADAKPGPSEDFPDVSELPEHVTNEKSPEFKEGRRRGTQRKTDGDTVNGNPAGPRIEANEEDVREYPAVAEYSNENPGVPKPRLNDDGSPEIPAGRQLEQFQDEPFIFLTEQAEEVTTAHENLVIIVIPQRGAYSHDKVGQHAQSDYTLSGENPTQLVMTVEQTEVKDNMVETKYTELENSEDVWTDDDMVDMLNTKPTEMDRLQAEEDKEMVGDMVGMLILADVAEEKLKTKLTEWTTEVERLQTEEENMAGDTTEMIKTTLTDVERSKSEEYYTIEMLETSLKEMTTEEERLQTEEDKMADDTVETIQSKLTELDRLKAEGDKTADDIVEMLETSLKEMTTEEERLQTEEDKMSDDEVETLETKLTDMMREVERLQTDEDIMTDDTVETLKTKQRELTTDVERLQTEEVKMADDTVETIQIKLIDTTTEVERIQNEEDKMSEDMSKMLTTKLTEIETLKTKEDEMADDTVQPKQAALTRDVERLLTEEEDNMADDTAEAPGTELTETTTELERFQTVEDTMADDTLETIKTELGILQTQGGTTDDTVGMLNIKLTEMTVEDKRLQPEEDKIVDDTVEMIITKQIQVGRLLTEDKIPDDTVGTPKIKLTEVERIQNEEDKIAHDTIETLEAKLTEVTAEVQRLRALSENQRCEEEQLRCKLTSTEHSLLCAKIELSEVEERHRKVLDELSSELKAKSSILEAATREMQLILGEGTEDVGEAVVRRLGEAFRALREENEALTAELSWEDRGSLQVSMEALQQSLRHARRRTELLQEEQARKAQIIACLREELRMETDAYQFKMERLEQENAALHDKLEETKAKLHLATQQAALTEKRELEAENWQELVRDRQDVISIPGDKLRSEADELESPDVQEPIQIDSKDRQDAISIQEDKIRSEVDHMESPEVSEPIRIELKDRQDVRSIQEDEIKTEAEGADQRIIPESPEMKEPVEIEFKDRQDVISIQEDKIRSEVEDAKQEIILESPEVSKPIRIEFRDRQNAISIQDDEIKSEVGDTEQKIIAESPEVPEPTENVNPLRPDKETETLEALRRENEELSRRLQENQEESDKLLRRQRERHEAAVEELLGDRQDEVDQLQDRVGELTAEKEALEERLKATEEDKQRLQEIVIQLDLAQTRLQESISQAIDQSVLTTRTENEVKLRSQDSSNKFTSFTENGVWLEEVESGECGDKSNLDFDDRQDEMIPILEEDEIKSEAEDSHEESLEGPEPIEFDFTDRQSAVSILGEDEIKSEAEDGYQRRIPTSHEMLELVEIDLNDRQDVISIQEDAIKSEAEDAKQGLIPEIPELVVFPQWEIRDSGAKMCEETIHMVEGNQNGGEKHMTFLIPGPEWSPTLQGLGPHNLEALIETLTWENRELEQQLALTRTTLADLDLKYRELTSREQVTILQGPDQRDREDDLIETLTQENRDLEEQLALTRITLSDVDRQFRELSSREQVTILHGPDQRDSDEALIEKLTSENRDLEQQLALTRITLSAMDQQFQELQETERRLRREKEAGVQVVHTLVEKMDVQQQSLEQQGVQEEVFYREKAERLSALVAQLQTELEQLRGSTTLQEDIHT